MKEYVDVGGFYNRANKNVILSSYDHRLYKFVIRSSQSFT